MEEALITRWETSEFVRRIWLAMQASTVYPPDLLPLLQNCVALYRQHLDADDVEDFCALRRLDAMLHGVEENWSDEWLLGHLPTTAQTTASGHGDLDVEKEFSEMRTRRQRSTFKVKPLRVKYVVLLHLFSGHRRHGDVQDQFERLQHTSSYPLHGLSVDIVISLKFENILDIEIQRLFRAAVHDGHIAAIVAGPPCETWSKAREQYYANQQGPRPVRTIEHPYGMQQLRLKELTQLLVGNDLLGAAVISVTLLGCFMLMEHPQEPPSEFSPAIWKLSIVKLLLQQPDIRRLRIWQGHYGSRSPKPTDLLCVHLTSDITEIFERHKTRLTLPKTMSIGKDESGRFKTQALKAYPAPLWAAIAQAAYAHVLARGVEDPQEVMPAKLDAAVRALDAPIGESSMGPDFCADGAAIQRQDWRSARAGHAVTPP